jgi:hypothetical protein
VAMFAMPDWPKQDSKVTLDDEETAILTALKSHKLNSFRIICDIEPAEGPKYQSLDINIQTLLA